MTDSLLDTALTAAAQSRPADGQTTPADTTTRPIDIPEKFWDSSTGTLRVEALVKSYRELEKRLSQRHAPPPADAPAADLAAWRDMLGIPATADAYQVNEPGGLGIDPEVNAQLHQACFSNAQVQLVYDMAAQRLLPLVAEAAQHYEAERQVEKLAQFYGGPERFQRIAKQLGAWGNQHLPKPVFDALSTTYEGVLAMERMMAGKEPAMARDTPPPQAATEAELRQMMRDPRYWQKREPAFVNRVTEGFRRLVGG